MTEGHWVRSCNPTSQVWAKPWRTLVIDALEDLARLSELTLDNNQVPHLVSRGAAPGVEPLPVTVDANKSVTAVFVEQHTIAASRVRLTGR